MNLNEIGLASAQKISDYLLLGAHHSTKNAQEIIARIVADTIAEKSRASTPLDIAVTLHHHKTSDADAGQEI
jgi:hypothetical protein